MSTRRRQPGLVVVASLAAIVACKDSVPPSNDAGSGVTPGATSGNAGTSGNTGTSGTSGSTGGTAADGASIPTGDASVPSSPPALGAHALAFQRYHAQNGVAVVSTPPIVTAGGGHSTMIVSVGRGAISAFAPPTDNKNAGAYPQLGGTHAYTLYPTSGTALYALTGALGGSGHVISSSTPTDDEVTVGAVEVLNATKIHDFKWNQVAANSPITSLSVTTTGPAVLVAYWWGDADVAGEKTAVPDGGFTVIDSILQSGALVQCAVATKTVSAAGTYNVTWVSTPVQGAQLWLAAVQ